MAPRGCVPFGRLSGERFLRILGHNASFGVQARLRSSASRGTLHEFESQSNDCIKQLRMEDLNKLSGPEKIKESESKIRRVLRYNDNVEVVLKKLDSPSKSFPTAEEYVSVAGPLGTLELPIVPGFKFEYFKTEDGFNNIDLIPERKELAGRNTMWGTTYSLIRNMILGVEHGYYVTLRLCGLGYRVIMEGDKLIFRLGYSSPNIVNIPSIIKAVVINPTFIVLFSIDLSQVTLFAGKIRSLRPPEPYNQKGIFVNGETIKKKEIRK